MSSEELRIAVIGDVGVDRGFISNEPSRPQAPTFQPWSYYPATHLFTFPGGAWFSGHMIQGSLIPAPFSHIYEAKVNKNAPPNATSINLSGTLACYAELPVPIPIDIDLTKGSSGVAILDYILIDGYMEHSTEHLSKIKVVIESNNVKNSSITLGLLDAQFEFDAYTSLQPGIIEPDTVHRQFKITNARIRGAAPQSPGQIPCNLLTVNAPQITVLLFYNNPKNSCEEIIKKEASSVSLASATSRRGDTAASQIATIHLPSDHGSAIFLSDAVVDVCYGTMTINHKVIDKGKLNCPEANGDNAIQNPIGVSLTKQEFQIPHSPKDIALALWMYKNPGRVLSMQHSGHIVHTLSELARFPQGPSIPTLPQVYRLKKRHGIDGPQHGYPTILNKHYQSPEPQEWHSEEVPRLVVIDDEGTGFCSRFECWLPYFWDPSANGHQPEGRPGSTLELTVDQKSTLRKTLKNTWVIIKSSHWINPSRNELITFLSDTELSNRTILIVSGDSLRGGLVSEGNRPGIKLAKTVSWERTLEDFEAALTSSKLGPLLSCRHVIVRIGLEGAIHFERKSDRHSVGNEQVSIERPLIQGKTWLYFDPELIEGEYEGNGEHGTNGEMPGLTTVFTAALVRDISSSIADKKEESEGLVLKKGILNGLQSARRFYDMGYGPTPATIRKYEQLQVPLTQIFGRGPLSIGSKRRSHKFEKFCVPEKLQRGEWSILNRQLQIPVPEGGRSEDETIGGDISASVSKAYNALTLGRSIVVRGPRYAFEKCPFNFPFARFGDLLAVDRLEIEGLRSIHNLLREYICHPERKVPLSIAVFGPPGSGKSFGVKQIAKMVAGERGIRESLFNLAQFEDFSEVSRILLQVRDAALEDKLPLVFFDEFDASLKGQTLGWLKYFLAPMNDGRFQHGQNMLGIGKAIFVFAGGIAASHEEFKSEEFWNNRAQPGNAGGNVFTAAKGPDFHSRLRGFLDIVGANPTNFKKQLTPQEDPYLNEDFAYVVRRALVIRQFIEDLAKRSDAALLDVEGRADIDRDVLDALLLAERYKHGVRSIHAILEMSSLHNQRSISKTAIPSTGQISMHVDETFGFLVRREENSLRSTILRILCKKSGSSAADWT